MSTYWRFYYHIVWGTKNRESTIAHGRVELIQQSIAAIAVDIEAMIFAIGIMPDHVHVVAAIPPRISVADAVQRMKGASSRRINQATVSPMDQFGWQPGYGAFTFGERSLDDVVAYVENQRDIHARREMRQTWEPRIAQSPSIPPNRQPR